MLLEESERGNVLALYDLGGFYGSDFFGEPGEELSAQYYSRAREGFLSLETDAGKQCAYLQYRIGKMYAYGLGTSQDETAAVAWFEKAANAGNRYAQYSLANCFYYGKGTAQNVSEAFRWYEKSAEKDMPYASYALGQMYANGDAVPQDAAIANAFYAKALKAFLALDAAGKADENLLYKIGQMYRKGSGTAADPMKALDYFQRADALGNCRARRIVGEELLLGTNIPQDVEKGCSKLVECIEKGDQTAAYQLAKFLLKDGKYCDPRHAVQLLESASAGMHWASFLLGRVYLSGAERVPPDREKATGWFAKSAEDGNPYAQEWLENMDAYEERMLADTVTGLFFSVGSLIKERYAQDQKRMQVESKLRRTIRRKMMELGIKDGGASQQQN